MEIGQRLKPYLDNFTGFLKKNKRYSVGVDIGSSSIKIVELEKSKGAIKLKNYALIKIKSDLNRDKIRKSSGQIVENIFKKMSINQKEVNLAIPSYSSFVTLIEVLGNKESIIEKEIEKNISKYIPINLDDVVYDWKIINFEENKEEIQNIKNDDSINENSEKTKVLLVSTTKNVSNDYEKSFEKSNLEVGSIEVDCFSIQRAFLGNQTGNYLIIDIGGKVTNFIGILKGQLVFNRNIDLAGDKLTELISKTLKVNKERAEMIKLKQGLKTDSKEILESVLKPFCDSIIEQAQKRIAEFKDLEEVSLDKIILNGGTSEMIGFKDYIEEKLGVDVVYGNPWSRIEYPKEIKDKILSYSPFFSVAVGLALIDFE